MVRSELHKILRETLHRLKKGGGLSLESTPEIHFEIPAQKTHGDFSTNVAMQLAKPEKKGPRDIAALILGALPKDSPIFIRAEIAGPGFINFYLHPEVYFKLLSQILKNPKNFGRIDLGKKKKVLLEFVSANPTGPLNIVSARAAAFGDSLANILDFAGYHVAREFYVNDVGNQIELFGESLKARYLQAKGEKADVPPEGYHGEYLEYLAQMLIRTKPKLSTQEDFKKFGLHMILTWQKRSLANFGVQFDRWFLQSSLFAKKEVARCVDKLKKEGLVYSEEGALHFRSTQFGDDKDRVVLKKDGEYTYFASDIAYHKNKLDRKFDQLIDIFGPDHHGYIARTKAAVESQGESSEKLKVLIVQQVNLMEGGEQVKMSKRAGKLVTLDQLLAEVGKDVARYFFLMRSANTHLDFDLALAKKETPENPVFYVQYAYARICSLFRKAKQEKIKENFKKIDWKELELEEEKQIAQMLLEYPNVIQMAAVEWEPHRLAFYLHELAQAFQSYYSKGRIDNRYRFVVSNNVTRTQAKLYLLKNAQIVLKSGLNLLGINAPEAMTKDEGHG